MPTHPRPEDHAATGTSSGDVLRALDRRYRTALEAYFARRLPGRVEPEDLAQEVLDRLVLRQQRWPGRNPEEYLFQVTASVARRPARPATARRSAPWDGGGNRPGIRVRAPHGTPAGPASGGRHERAQLQPSAHAGSVAPVRPAPPWRRSGRWLAAGAALALAVGTAAWLSLAS